VPVLDKNNKATNNNGNNNFNSNQGGDSTGIPNAYANGNHFANS
jgi:hypothetical protein